MKTPKTLSQAVDQAIARENAAILAKMCPFCMGTGIIYRERPREGRWDRYECPTCKGTGLK